MNTTEFHARKYDATINCSAMNANVERACWTSTSDICPTASAVMPTLFLSDLHKRQTTNHSNRPAAYTRRDAIYDDTQLPRQLYIHDDSTRSSHDLKGLHWIEQCFTPPPTQYRLHGRRFLQAKRPNQQYQSAEGTNSRLYRQIKHTINEQKTQQVP